MLPHGGDCLLVRPLTLSKPAKMLFYESQRSDSDTGRSETETWRCE